MVARKEVSQAVQAEAKRLYEQTLTPVNDIAAMMDLSRSVFFKRVREWKWARRRASIAPFEFVRAFTTAVAAERPAPAAGAASTPNSIPALTEVSVQGGGAAPAPAPATVERTALAARLLELVGRQMDAIDKTFNSIGPAEPGEADRSSRTIANLGRALREIQELLKPEEVNETDEADDDSVPIDIDAFRFELARRINEFVDARRRGQGGSGD